MTTLEKIKRTRAIISTFECGKDVPEKRESSSLYGIFGHYKELSLQLLIEAEDIYNGFYGPRDAGSRTGIMKIVSQAVAACPEASSMDVSGKDATEARSAYIQYFYKLEDCLRGLVSAAVAYKPG